MMDWLRRFLYSDDPMVRVAGGLLEPERAREAGKARRAGGRVGARPAYPIAWRRSGQQCRCRRFGVSRESGRAGEIYGECGRRHTARCHARASFLVPPFVLFLRCGVGALAACPKPGVPGRPPLVPPPRRGRSSRLPRGSLSSSSASETRSSSSGGGDRTSSTSEAGHSLTCTTTFVTWGIATPMSSGQARSRWPA